MTIQKLDTTFVALFSLFQVFTEQLKKEHYEILDRIHNLKITPTGEGKDYDLHFTSLRTMLVEILEILRIQPAEEEHIEIMYYDGPCRCNEFRGEKGLQFSVTKY